MAGYVVLLILPVIIGVFIAAGVLVINGRRQRRIDTARTMLEARRRDALSLSDPAATEQSSAATRRRIAS